ncbi:alpha/beta fold hydrolase [Rhodoplanes sp. TEM]|uniref:alpha/beta fold hydrolase n=1 Tax=Rhodoplanes sp. TEM TaxID=3025489 RepID=UPI002350F552|nr:alpha/beta fold hydrolase [Rhodoplanes sp. TEM]
MRDGTELFYRIDGTGPGRVALVHSLAADHAFWEPVVARLGDAATLLTFDCRGHGASGKPAGPYTVEQFGDDLADLMDRAGWPSAVVAGASMGGCVALAFAARHPQRTKGLGLIDTTAWYGAEAPQQWAERAGKAKSDGLAALVGFQTTRWFGDAFRAGHPDVVQHTVDTFLKNDIAAYAETCRMLGAADLRAALPGIAVPTRIVVGEEDYATPPAMAEALHAGIAGSTLTVIAGGRHLTPLDNPDRIAAELRMLIEAAR